MSVKNHSTIVLSYQLILSWQTKDTSDTHLVFLGVFKIVNPTPKKLTRVVMNRSATLAYGSNFRGVFPTKISK
jgi:hypothetical protein